MDKLMIRCGEFNFIDIAAAEAVSIIPDIRHYAGVVISYKNTEDIQENTYIIENKELLTQFLMELDKVVIQDDISLPSITEFVNHFDALRNEMIAEAKQQEEYAMSDNEDEDID